MSLTVWAREAVSTCRFSLSSVRFRLQPAVIAVIGFCGVVLVFIGLLSIRDGLTAVLAHTGSDDVAIVSNDGPGMTDLQTVRAIGEAPGVAQGPAGPLALGDLVTSIMAHKDSGTLAAVTLRGVGPGFEHIWNKVQIVQGRLFRSGLDEVVVGRAASQQFPQFRLGNTFQWNHHEWKVVGIFSSGGDMHESEVWADVHDVQAAYNAGNNFSGVYVKLTSAAAFDGFEKALKSNPQLNVSVDRESTYFANASKDLDGVLTVAGGVIALLMGIGAVFGALITMYAAVAARTREIATLRALGFSRSPVVLSVVVEALLLGAAGGIVGGLIGYLLFNGFKATTIGNGGMLAFQFAVTPSLLATGVIYALLMGLVGGLFPAIRAARLPIATAIRDV
ncbi:MAG TPA: FtsX-like permease family protein [Gammaproteobacteria bacterium]|nr:FtsX-like permease family protein [Gammaproteobacteria bacterium]